MGMFANEWGLVQMIYECQHIYYIIDRFCEQYRRSGSVCHLNIIHTDGLYVLFLSRLLLPRPVSADARVFE